jgi:hypothetical protein
MHLLIDLSCMLPKLLIMKTVLRGTVSAIVLTICISGFISQKSMAAGLPVSKNSNSVYVDTAVKSPIDSITVDPDYKVIILSETQTLRFHFTISKGSSPAKSSAVFAADFDISKGFAAVYDAKRVALLLVDKAKTGNGLPSVTKAELATMNIPQP